MDGAIFTDYPNSILFSPVLKVKKGKDYNQLLETLYSVMGNAGSANNLQNDCVQSELNLFYTQQYLRRTTGETKKKNQLAIGGGPSGRSIADCRVLPKPTEKLKLKSTTNGAILQAGGTISFRAKELKELECKNEPTNLHPMRRCHTLILDSQNDSIYHRKTATPVANFRRSQTLIHVDYSKRKSQENISKTFDCFKQPPVQNKSTTSTLKVNKYNKKRKAPAAPTNISPKEETTTATQNYLFCDTKNPSLPKPRIYATNCSKSAGTSKQLSAPAMKNTLIQRDSKARISVNTSRPIQHVSPTHSSKLPYRREKTFDVKLLRRKETSDFSDRRATTETKMELSTLPNKNTLEEELDCKTQDNNNKKQRTYLQQDKNASNKIFTTLSNTYHSQTNYSRDKTKGRESLVEERTTQSNINKDKINNGNYSKFKNSTDERKSKYPQSRIPQLKRTFYFGMETSNISFNHLQVSPKPKNSNDEKTIEENEDMVDMVLNHNIKAEEEILDNGILVHVRPTLPRRQQQTPSFSPSAAWQHLHTERSKAKQIFSDVPMVETPICLISNTRDNYVCRKANWIPQQDLEDDEEGEENDAAEHKCQSLKYKGKMAKNPENYTNSLHVFSLSLPRDVHLQGQTKSSMDFTEQQNSLKATNCWLVPGFNSLQKLKTQLGKNPDLRSNLKCNCASNTTIKRNSYKPDCTFGDSFSMDSNCHHRPDCELNKTSTSTCFQSDNWFLHKSKSKNAPLAVASKNFEESCLKTSLNSPPLANFQPKSLSNIYSGKHIVYLPGQDPLNASNKKSYKNSKHTKTNKSTFKRQRQRQETVRESLQDLTPIQNTHQSNVNVDEKSTHRFSFQSTVRVLEKRRLAEKLSKDAELQEAQRLNELEAMKRVEEDFQRKRAPEKANLRNQLRLHLKANTEKSESRSLPLHINEKYSSQQPQKQQISDVNNNIFCRAEPDGAVSPSLELNHMLPKIRCAHFSPSIAKSSKELECYEYDEEESECETQLQDLQCAALLIEPYLHSII